ncbi:trypsin-like peptidase domain-containing protein [Actinoplanes sp. NPDC051861]|uniref:S1C family serine protease n=1 Tax=Actinoplanes sp. NPDC051861 TaxID=3155170 RepID=UPI0034227226
MAVSTGRIVAGALGVALVAGAAGGAIGAAVAGDSGDTGEPAAAAQAPAGSSCDVASVAARVFPSLVTVNVQLGDAGGLGSGSVWDRDGHILTNDHVLAPAVGGTVTVDFARGPAAVPATVVGRDPATDLAVIKVDPSAARLTPITVGDSSALVVGQPVVAAGSPLGLNGTITAGVVSALSRYVDVGQGDDAALLVNAVQVDAAVNPGNSGGPLVDCAGRQVGVNSAGAQTSEAAAGGSIGLNFAIPSDFAGAIAAQLIENGKARHPILGVLSVTVTDEMARSTGLPRGALVEQVLPGFGAAGAGVRAGDVITSVAGTGVNSTDQMLAAVQEHSPGDTVEVGFSRAGAAQRVTAKVSEP